MLLASVGLLAVPWLTAGSRSNHDQLHDNLVRRYVHSRAENNCTLAGDRNCGFRGPCQWYLDRSVKNASNLISSPYDPVLSIVATCPDTPRGDTFTQSKLPLDSCVWNHDGVLDWGRYADGLDTCDRFACRIDDAATLSCNCNINETDNRDSTLQLNDGIGIVNGALSCFDITGEVIGHAGFNSICRNITFTEPSTLSAECPVEAKNITRSPVKSYLDLNHCLHNSNGTLDLEEPGNAFASCTNSSIHDSVQLQTTCRSIDQAPLDAYMDLGFFVGVWPQNGTLVCLKQSSMLTIS